MAPLLKPICVLSTVVKKGISRVSGTCESVTWRKLVTKTGERFDDILTDHGQGIFTSYRVGSNNIRYKGSDGQVVTYTREHLGTLVTEVNGTSRLAPGKLYDDIYNIAYRGLV